MQLSDVEWGDVLSDSDGVLVVQGVIDGRDVVVKRFAEPRHRREIAVYELLERLGVPTLPRLGSGDDWLVVLEAAEAGFRVASERDRDDPRVAIWVARWYDQLHAAGTNVPGLAELYHEPDLVTPESLALLAQRRPELASSLQRVAPRVDGWLAEARGFEQTLTHHDFDVSNVAVDDFGERAVVFDLNLLGAGYRWSDLRNVTSGLSARAGRAFLDEYRRLASARGVTLDEREAVVDEPLSHLVALVTAAARDRFPDWAEPSRQWLLSQ